MGVRLHRPAFDYAKRLIDDGRVVRDTRDDWSEHQPTAADENRFIEEHGWAEYGRWHLGVDDEQGEETKRRYKFPYGDFARVHRCAIITAESRAGQYDYDDVKQACVELHARIDPGAHAA